MRPLDIIAHAPWPTPPVFLASAMMPFVYVAAARTEPVVFGLAPDPLMLTVLVRMVLHFALKVPPALVWMRRRPDAAVLLTLIGLTVTVAPATLIWANSALATQLIWSGLFGTMGVVGLWQSLSETEGAALRDLVYPSLRADPGRLFGTHLIQSLNVALFALICAILAAVGPEALWVLYAGIGWIVQYWVMGWVWVAWWRATGDR